jgi:hypothetical protein
MNPTEARKQIVQTHSQTRNCAVWSVRVRTSAPFDRRQNRWYNPPRRGMCYGAGSLCGSARGAGGVFPAGRGGLYRTVFSGSEGVYRSRVLEGFWLDVGWLWARPPLWEVLKQLGLA